MRGLVFHPSAGMQRLRFSPEGVRWLRFSPLGESLSFASPKESNQRKGDPASLPFGYPIWRARTGAPPTRPGKAHKTCLAADLEHGSAYFPSAHAKSADLRGNKPRNRHRVKPTGRQAQTLVKMPLLCRREAQPAEAYDLSRALARRKSESPCGRKRGGVSELRSRARFVCPDRASSRPASAGEHRREAAGRYSRGGLFFGDFLLATQKKVTRPQAKIEAVATPQAKREASARPT
jgi:hypothetical protein